MSTMPTQGQFDIGRVISRLFGVLGRNLPVFALLALLLVGAPAIAVALTALLRTLPASLPTSPAELFTPINIGLGLGSVLISVIANSVLQGAVIHGTVSDLAGRPASFGDCLATGIRFILPLIGIGLISGIAIGAASILLVVPGVLLALAWAVAAPAAVMERTGVFGAFSRSADLTRNHRGAIFGLAVIYIVVALVVQYLESSLMRSVTGVSLVTTTTQNLQTAIIIRLVANGLIQTMTALVSAAGVASIYYELRSIKDGVGAEQLAAVFD